MYSDANVSLLTIKIDDVQSDFILYTKPILFVDCYQRFFITIILNKLVFNKIVSKLKKAKTSAA